VDLTDPYMRNSRRMTGSREERKEMYD